jgi:hypothetical protein
MLKKQLLIISLLTIISITAFHFFSIKNSWYWTYRWLDIPVHIVAGFWVAITTLWVSLNMRHIDSIVGYKNRALFAMLASVLIVAVLWEIFELIFKITSLHDTGYWQDSLSDIFNGFAGGVIAFLYFTRNRKAKSPVAEIAHGNNFVVIL